MTDHATIGDNLPDTEIDPLLERLRENHADLIKRRGELLYSIDQAPTDIDDEASAGELADFIQIEVAEFIKGAKRVHHDEKMPFLAAGRTVDSFLHTLVDAVEEGKLKVNGVRKRYADAKAAEERRRRDEEARVARAEAQRIEQEAAERAAAMQKSEDLVSALRAEGEADQARRDAEKAEKVAAEKPAQMGRSRGERGGMTTLKQFWDHADLDREAIDLNALREHLPMDAIEQAVRSYIKAGGRTLTGVRIFENTRL